MRCPCTAAREWLLLAASRERLRSTEDPAQSKINKPKSLLKKSLGKVSFLPSHSWREPDWVIISSRLQPSIENSNCSSQTQALLAYLSCLRGLTTFVRQPGPSRDIFQRDASYVELCITWLFRTWVWEDCPYTSWVPLSEHCYRAGLPILLSSHEAVNLENNSEHVLITGS